MKASKSLFKSLLPLSLILICSDLTSLPSSSFIIIPDGIERSVYSENKTLYKVTSSDEDFSLPGTASQKIISVETGNGKSTVTVMSGEPSADNSEDLNRYLKNTPYLNTDKESIRKAAGDFKNSKDRVKDVSVFVYNHITDKKIGIPFIPAVSILKGRTGDCTEHSILAISLLRALNVPARGVIGIILSENFSGRENVFVYHMWVEAYQNGRWIITDPTRPYDIRPNRYIALAYHNLMTEAPLEYLQAVSTMRDMKISYIRR